MMNSSMVMATSGEPRICTAAAWLRPSSESAIVMTAAVSGTSATDVSRCHQKCSVPDFAGPRPRTRPSGVRIVMTTSSSLTAHHQVADDPQQQGEHDRSEQRGARQPFALVGAEAIAQIPDQVANPAKHVMDERPGVAKQQEPTNQAADKILECRVGGWPGGGGNQPPGKQDEAEIERRTGETMDDRHHHRQHRAVDLQVRGNGTGVLETGR